MSASDLLPLPCYLDGRYGVLPDARVSVMDRGFIFGDGVYEVVPVYGRAPFRIHQHLARLERSLSELRIANPYDDATWRGIVATLVERYDAGPWSAGQKIAKLIYLQVTRGVAMREHPMLPGLVPTVFAMCSALPRPGQELREHGIACVTADDFRWEKAHIKSTSLLGAVMARQISVDAGAAETLMFRHGFLSEAAASNIWVVKDGAIQGPPKNHLVLEGIRYGYLEELCARHGVPFRLRPISRDEVLAADELLITSASKEILPITTLDGQPVGDGRPGAVYRVLRQAYDDDIAAIMLANIPEQGEAG